jgi:DNA-directed RNA polymerase specialized sigma24 family protein
MDIPETGVMRMRVLYHQHGAALIAPCLPVDEQCEDVVQETLLRASQHQEVVDGDGTVKSRLHYARRTVRRTLQEMGVEQ